MALQFLKHPVKVGVPAVAKLRDDPLGEGITKRVPESTASNEAGDNE